MSLGHIIMCAMPPTAGPKLALKGFNDLRALYGAPPIPIWDETLYHQAQVKPACCTLTTAAPLPTVADR